MRRSVCICVYIYIYIYIKFKYLIQVVYTLNCILVVIQNTRITIPLNIRHIYIPYTTQVVSHYQIHDAGDHGKQEDRQAISLSVHADGSQSIIVADTDVGNLTHTAMTHRRFAHNNVDIDAECTSPASYILYVGSSCSVSDTNHVGYYDPTSIHIF